MIYRMQHDLPHRYRVGIAAHVFKGDIFRHIDIPEMPHPELPALVEGGPFGLEQREIAILRIDKCCPWLCQHARQPNPICGIDMRQGVEHAFVGCLEVARQFFRWKLGGEIQQALRGPA